MHSGVRRHRAAFTLLELLLVLAILVSVAAMVIPDVGRTLDSHRLRNAAEQVRVAWAKCRVQAMESGRTYTFRFEPSGRLYVIEPWNSQDDYLESSELLSQTAPATSELAGQRQAKQEELPESVQFISSQSAEDSRAFLLTQGNNASINNDGQWSAPIFFYPDGTTSTSQLLLTNSRGRSMQVSVRGLTGVIYVKDAKTPPGVIQ